MLWKKDHSIHVNEKLCVEMFTIDNAIKVVALSLHVYFYLVLLDLILILSLIYYSISKSYHSLQMEGSVL